MCVDPSLSQVVDRHLVALLHLLLVLLRQYHRVLQVRRLLGILRMSFWLGENRDSRLFILLDPDTVGFERSEQLIRSIGCNDGLDRRSIDGDDQCPMFSQSSDVCIVPVRNVVAVFSGSPHSPFVQETEVDLVDVVDLREGDLLGSKGGKVIVLDGEGAIGEDNIVILVRHGDYLSYSKLCASVL